MAKKRARAAAGRLRGCTLRMLPSEMQVEAAQRAVALNPANAPVGALAAMLPALAVNLAGPDVSLTRHEGRGVLDPAHLAVLTSRYWGTGGVKLPVYFMDTQEAALRNKILHHMNAWGEFCNVSFAESSSRDGVRLARGPGGYWSYLGTDVLSIPKNQPTMNLEGFTLRTPESEFVRVVRHEAGHTCGFPHEHMRRAIIARLDAAKTVAYFRRTQGWSEQVTRQQVLTPLEESSVMASDPADEDSIMAYQLPASITKDGRPVRGGADFSAADRAFAARLYPKAEPPPPPSGKRRVVLEISGTVETVRIAEIA